MKKILTLLIIALFCIVPRIVFPSESFQITGLDCSPTPIIVNSDVTFTVLTDTPNLYYRFFTRKNYGDNEAYNTTPWLPSPPPQWSTENAFTWTPSSTDRYVIVAHVVDNLEDTSDVEIIGLSVQVIDDGVFIDVSGTWTFDMTFTGCGLNLTETDTATVSQDGQNVTVDIPSEDIIAEGILRGNYFTATNPPYSFPLLGGTMTITEMSATFTNGGNSVSLSGLATYTAIGGNICEVTITATGEKEPATDRFAQIVIY